MMSIHASEQKWIEEIRQYTIDPRVESMIGQADIPHFFVRVIQMMLHSCQLPAERKVRFAIGITLLQMGLDVHDRIPTHSNSPATAVTSRQLLVLAGDFYSSQYYRLFSQHGELAAISFISERVGSINQSRLNLHLLTLDHKQLPEAAYPDLLHFTSGLATALADFFHVEEVLSLPWQEVFPQLLLVQFISCRPEWSSQLTDRLRKHIHQEWANALSKVGREAELTSEVLSLFKRLSPWVDQQLLLGERNSE